jgi:hypothetical protein
MMTPPKTLLREWVVLVALLAMMIGPLAVGVSRSLAAQERVAIASGITALPLCQSGDALNAAGGVHTLSSCDQCLPGMVGPLPSGTPTSLPLAIHPMRFDLADVGSAVRAATGLPPATGPPVSLI